MRLFANSLRATLTVFAVWMCCAPVRAEIILGRHDWDNGEAEGWSTLDSWVTVDDSPTTEQPWLNITFNSPAPEPPDQEWATVVQVQAVDLFAGTWTPDMFVEFDFWAEETTPTALQLQWASSTNSSQVWTNSLTVPEATGGWTGYRVSFANWNDWLSSGASEDQYLSDLSSMDWIGIYIARSGADPQSYQLDDFRLMIPEPSQVVMLSSAVLACLASLRRRRRDGHEKPALGP